MIRKVKKKCPKKLPKTEEKVTLVKIVGPSESLGEPDETGESVFKVVEATRTFTSRFE